MDAWVVFYQMKGLSPKIRTKVLEQLFGKTQLSNYSRYSYRTKGILAIGTYFRPVKAALVLKKRYLQKVTRLFDAYQIQYRCYEIKVDPADFKKEEN